MKFPQYFMIWLEILDFDGNYNLAIFWVFENIPMFQTIVISYTFWWFWWIFVNLLILVNFMINSLHSCELNWFWIIVHSGEYDGSGDSVESGDPDEYGEPGNPGTW